MVFCVSCGHKLAGRYCGQCGGDSHAGITPFKDGQWKQYVETSFLAKGSPAASHMLHEVHKLQHKNAISAYLFNLGLDDQNPEDWNDHEVRMDLVVPDPSDPSSDEGGDSREGEGGGEMQDTAPVLIIPSPEISSSEEEEDLEHDMEEKQEEKKEASRKTVSYTHLTLPTTPYV